MNIEYHPAVERELQEARDYYESRAPGLGIQFIEEFEHQVTKIAANPSRWMEVAQGVRRSLMNRFPYVIYFRLTEADKLRITVVKHQRRHPAFGKERT